MLNIYLTNLGKYNEGILQGEWVELPITDEELEKVFERIGINEEYEEYFITDFESDFGYHVNEYDNLDELNEIAEKIEDIDEDQGEIVKALIHDLGYTVDEAIDKITDGDYIIWSDCDSMTDVAYKMVEEYGYLNDIPENVARYFDYESYGRDIGIEGTFIFMDNGDCVEVIRQGRGRHERKNIESNAREQERNNVQYVSDLCQLFHGQSNFLQWYHGRI